MRGAVFKIMLLSLMRDRGALAMSFILPGLVFAIFAVALAAASGGQLAVKVSIADLRQDDISGRIVDQLKSSDSLRVGSFVDNNRARVVLAVRDGRADVGLVIRKQILSEAAGVLPERPMFELITDPAREIATTMVQANLQQAALELGSRPRREEAELFERSMATTSGSQFTAAAYYAGAVSVMFVLYSALTSAASYLEEREQGLLERIVSGPGGAGVVIDGKFLFIAILGFVQTSLVFLMAWVVFDVDLPAHLTNWAITTACVSIACAGLMIAFITFLRTKRQAETLGQMLVVVLSAIGGSMVPRFMMPEEVQTIGWVTPNSWALDAYATILWLGDDVNKLHLPWSMLLAMGFLGLLVARVKAAWSRTA